MYIEKEGCYDQNKKIVYVDIDDVLFKSSERVIEILKETYPDELKDIERKDFLRWGYENLKPNLNIELIFESNAFLDKIEFDEKVLAVIEEEFNNFNWVFVTKGTERNLIYKYAMIFTVPVFLKNMDKIGFYGMFNSESKGQIDMSNGIQIDDFYWNLVETNADVKILYRHPDTNGDTDYNGVKVVDGRLDNLYICEFGEEFKQILDFVCLYGLSDEDLFKQSLNDKDAESAGSVEGVEEVSLIMA